MQIDAASILSHLNGLMFARRGRRKSENAFQDDMGSQPDDTCVTSVSLVRMAKLSKVREAGSGGDLQSQTSPPPEARSSHLPQQPEVSVTASGGGEGGVAAEKGATMSMNSPTQTAAPPPLPPRRPGDLPPLSGKAPNNRRVSAPAGAELLPPPPPQRNTSLPTPSGGLRTPSLPTATDSFEARFRFHPESSFPPPETFTDCKKTYTSLMSLSKATPGRGRGLPPLPAQPPPL